MPDPASPLVYGLAVVFALLAALSALKVRATRREARSLVSTRRMHQYAQLEVLRSWLRLGGWSLLSIALIIRIVMTYETPTRSATVLAIALVSAVAFVVQEVMELRQYRLVMRERDER